MGQMATFYTFFWKLKMMTKPRIQLKNMMQFCWWRKGFNIPDLTENLAIKGLIVPDDNDDDDDNEDDSLEWSQGSHNQLDLSKTILKFYPSCFHHLARLGSHSNIFRCGCIWRRKYISFVLNSEEIIRILWAFGLCWIWVIILYLSSVSHYFIQSFPNKILFFKSHWLFRLHQDMHFWYLSFILWSSTMRNSEDLVNICELM